MEGLKKFVWIGYGLLFALVTAWSFRVPDAAMFNEPSLARIIFFHLPCAFVGLTFYVWSVVMSWRYLSSREMRFDIRTEATNEMATIFFALTMATGILFSYVQWGAWWQGDPRQTSFLLVLMLQFAYMLLRSAFTDEQKRASVAAVYNVACFLPIVFLVFVFPRLPQVASLSSHPSQTIQKGLLVGEYLYVFLAVWALLTLFGIKLVLQRIAVESVRLNREEMDGKLDISGDTAGFGVVRPISVPDEHGKEG